jgi:hypothetical protein
MKAFQRTAAVIALATLFAPVASAKPAKPKSPLVSGLEKCRQVTDSSARLTCYDRAAGALLTAADRGDISVVDRAELRQTRRSLFGFGMPKLPFFAGDTSADEGADQLDSTIKSARAVGNGRFRLVISDGNAVWETLESYMSMSDPRAGQKIRIRRGPLGSFVLQINGQRGVKGKRVG